MPQRLRLLPFFAVVLFPVFLHAQTSPEMAGILERLDRLERQNRELLDEVRSLRAELASARIEPTPEPSPAAATVEDT